MIVTITNKNTNGIRTIPLGEREVMQELTPADPNYGKIRVGTNGTYGGEVLLAKDSDLVTNNIGRADKYLSAQNIANMVYVSGDLVKIQYNAATDIDYEVFSYTLGNLTGIAHYVDSVLKGNSVLSYTGGDLSSVVFTGV